MPGTSSVADRSSQAKVPLTACLPGCNRIDGTPSRSTTSTSLRAAVTSRGHTFPLPGNGTHCSSPCTDQACSNRPPTAVTDRSSCSGQAQTKSSRVVAARARRPGTPGPVPAHDRPAADTGGGRVGRGEQRPDTRSFHPGAPVRGRAGNRFRPVPNSCTVPGTHAWSRRGHCRGRACSVPSQGRTRLRHGRRQASPLQIPCRVTREARGG